ncbi:endonuclease domain-containing protein [Maribellus sp. YY47]|uniref:endonuclease domain-containing protein n=1 Tax=Maribellus sp. YY47 TaxID=2929486 RepID=UPI0020009D50|nr:endonuclease domain-containing protein [Maribellus sp. YY47]MCK3684024.1 endonuclease domain-containing protein [Maribellus sp. YY47]
MSNNHTPISRARKLRREMTEEELILWQKLRGRKFLGLKFLRQHPIIYDRINNEPKYFIPDFYCAEKKLVIEVDGKIHEFQKGRDRKREEILNGAGLCILRIKNEEIENDVFTVLKKIEAFILENSP